MNIVDLLQRLRERGVTLSVENGRLKTAAPKGAIDAELALLLRDRKHALIAFLARAAEQRDASNRIGKAAPAASYPLSFAQQRLWFIDRLEGGSPQYNLPLALKLSGRLGTSALQDALDALVARHAVLRTRFAEIDGEPRQIVAAADSVALRRIDLVDVDGALQEARLRELAAEDAARPFDLAADAPLRCTLIRLAERAHALLFTLHHIASDGWSIGVLVREITALYTAIHAGGADPLPPLEIQYADYAEWQRERLRGDALATQLDWWRTELEGAPAVLELPTTGRGPRCRATPAATCRCVCRRS